MISIKKEVDVLIYYSTNYKTTASGYGERRCIWGWCMRSSYIRSSDSKIRIELSSYTKDNSIL